jgi:hypothetical protein
MSCFVLSCSWPQQCSFLIRVLVPDPECSKFLKEGNKFSKLASCSGMSLSLFLALSISLLLFLSLSLFLSWCLSPSLSLIRVEFWFYKVPKMPFHFRGSVPFNPEPGPSQSWVPNQLWFRFADLFRLIFGPDSSSDASSVTFLFPVLVLSGHVLKILNFRD